MASVQTQPSTVKLTFKSILTLPFRLCNPPPAVGKVRSFTVTPLFNVRLDDVLDRKHLPPLGLKDFEEWLLYVEMCPENLYFILWLREYRFRHTEWQKQRNSPKDAVSASNTASRLAMFYSRAKHTFFTPDSQYELNLPSTILTPLQKPDQDPHPDPSFFAPAEIEARRMLEQSLRRFIHGQMTNVGNSRVLCGIIAGTFLIVVGFIPPIVANFVVNASRWLRLTGFPGMWIGLTILLAALHGVCMGVYIFGDLRQLRKFELARPPISKHNRSPESHLRIPPHPVVLPPTPPTPAYTHPRRSSQPRVDRSRLSSVASIQRDSDSSSAAYPRESHSIQANPVYNIETNFIDGPATCPIIAEYCSPQNDGEWLRQQELQRQMDQQMEMEREPRSPDSFTSTATFIGPFRSPSTTHLSRYWDDEELSSVTARWYQLRTTEDLESLGDEAAKRQPLSEFDFDGLPPPPMKRNGPNAARGGENLRSSWDDEERRSFQWLFDFFDRVQTRCSFKKWGPTSGGHGPGPSFLGGLPPYLSSKSSRRSNSNAGFETDSRSILSLSTCTTVNEDTKTTERVKKRSRLVLAVPAFAVPLTKVLNPIIVRGQWEIVVRSAAFAFLITWVVCGSLLAVPVR